MKQSLLSHGGHNKTVIRTVLLFVFMTLQFWAQAQLTVTTDSINNVSCKGYNDGGVFLSVTGGTPPYSFNWNSGDNTEDITGLSAGTYVCIVSDASFNVQFVGATVLEAPTLMTATKFVTDVSCNGGNNGTIDITVSGGVAPYFYSWSNGATSQDVSNLVSGIYSVTITDNYGCVLTLSDTVGEPSKFLSLGMVPTPVSCFGGSDGNVDFSVAGGILPYSYIWSNGVTTQDLSGVAAGTYTVVATDNKGCKVYDTVVVTEPASALSTVSAITKSTCFNSPDGAIDITTSGGTAPYTFSWNTGATTEDLNGVSAGTYTITITDSKGCILIENHNVTTNDTIPPVAQCQNITAYLDASGNLTITANDIDNGSTDNCAIDTLILDNYNFTCANIGSNNVELYVFDSNGNSDTCSATVNVLDTVPPVVSTNNITVYLDAAGQASITTSDIDNASTDACGIDTTFLDIYDFTCADLGAQAVSFTAVDVNGNSASLSATVTIVDTIIPDAVAKGSITVYLDANGLASITAAQLDSGSTDICGIDTLTLSQYDFSCADLGANTITLTATDGSGNSDATVSNVIVMDTVAPVINGQNASVNLDFFGNASITVADVVVASNDSCGIDTIVLDKYNFTCADVGVNQVVITATDLNGNVSNLTVNVTVIDNNVPAVSANDITVYLDAAGVASITVGDVMGFTLATCGVDTTYLDQYNFSCLNVGVNKVALIAMSVNGVMGSDTSMVTVLDTNAPAVTTQNISVYLDATGNASISAAQIDNGSSDACGIDTLILDTYNFTCADAGLNNVNLTAIDVNGNTAVAAATVDVLDTTAPVVTAQNISVYLDVNGQASITTGDVVNSASDNCSIDTVILSKYDFNCIDTGANSVVITVIDPSGNSSDATANVLIIDTIIPTVLAQDITVYLDGNGQVSITAGQVDAGSATACGMDTLYLDKYDFTCADIGVNQVILTAVKLNGISTTDTSMVTVVDTLGPVINPSAITTYLDSAGNVSITVADIDPALNDGCGLDTAYLDITAFNCANIGANTVTITASDVYGNTSVATATVTVADTIGPDFTVNNITLYLDNNGQASIAVADVSTAASDACGIDTVILDQYDFTCADAGANTINITATDVNGNATMKQATVTVADTINPVVAALNIDVYLDLSGFATIDAMDVLDSATDACGIDTLILDNYSFSCADLGASVVSITATDVAGNSASANATVTVYDTVSPAIITDPITVYLDTSGSVSVRSVAPFSYLHEACALDTVFFSQEIFSCADLGNNKIGITAIDASGNVMNDSITVSVNDTAAPVMVNQNITVYLDITGTATITVADVNQSSTDDCGVDTVFLDRYTFNCSDIGANMVTVTAIDLNGTIGTSTAIVTVSDTIVPLAKSKNITVYLDANGLATITVADVDNGSLDGNCGYSLSISDSVFDCAELGLNLESLSITDGSGNVTSVDFFVTVLDTMKPLLALKNLTISLDANGVASVGNASSFDNGTTDNCATFLAFTASKTQFTCADVGVSTVTVTATDNKLNTATGTATVTVVDGIAPVVATQNITIYLDASGNATATAGAVDNGTADNCGIDSIWLSKSGFTGQDLGANQVSLFAKDLGGNTSNGPAVITVLDTMKPVIVSGKVDLYLDANGQATFTGTAPEINVTDNHSVASVVAPQTNFTCSDIGTLFMNVTATDASGNTAIKRLVFNIMDSISPVVKVNNVTVYINASGNASISTSTINNGSTDNCGIQNITLSKTNFSCADIGPNAVMMTVTDPSNNSSSAVALVTVVDNVAPQLIGVPKDTVVEALANCTTTLMFAVPSVVDNCASTTTFASNHWPGDAFPLGTTKVIFTATDASGNADTASFKVTVVDNTAPMVTSIPADDTIGACNSFFNYPMPTAMDNCGGVTITQIGGIPSGGYYPIGTTLNVFKIQDSNGNDTIVSFSVVVEPVGQPSLPNTLSLCENDAPVDFAQGQTIDFSGKGMSDPTLFDPATAGPGRHALTYTYIDQNGCLASGSITITVNAAPTKPSITRIASNTLSTGAYDSYQWYRDGKPISGATSQTLTYTTGGNYQVLVSNVAGCTSHSTGYVVGASGGGIGIEENILNNLTIYPNPSTGEINIDLNNFTREELKVNVYDITGKLIYSAKDFTQATGVLRLDLRGLPKAQYIVQVVNDTDVAVHQIILH